MNESVKEKILTFFSAFPSQEVKRTRILIRPEDPPDTIYFVESGFVRQYIISEAHEEVTVNIFKPLSFFPMMGLVTGMKNTYYFVTASDCRIRRAPSVKVLTFVKENPNVLYDLLRRLYIGIDGLLIQMEQLMSSNARKRITTLLTLLGKRIGEKSDVGKLLKIRLTHQQLASLTGLSRETVSREMKKLEREKFFRILTGHICLLR